MTHRQRITPLICALALLLGGCAAPSAPTPTPGPTRIGFGGLDPERAAYQPAIDAFNAANPDIQVEFVSLEPLLSEGKIDDISRRVAQAADTFTSMLSGPDAESSRYLADMRPLMEADATFSPGDFVPGALPDGRLTVLPTTLSVQTLSYDRARWLAAGLAPPEPGWSWADLLAAAEGLTLREGDAVRSPGLDDGRGGMLALQGLLAEAGAPLAPGADGTIDLRAPAVADAVTRVADLIERGVIASADRAASQDTERAAMWVGGDLFGMMIGGMAEGMVEGATGAGGAPGEAVAPEDLGDAALPPLPRNLALSPRGYSMSAGSAHPEAAWRWLSFLSAQTISFGGGLIIIGAGYDVPARGAVAEAQGFWQSMPAERAAVIRAAIDRAASMPSATDPAVAEALGDALARAASGTPASEALADASTRLAERLAERASQPTPAPADLQVRLPDPVTIPEGATQIRFSALGQDPAAIRQIVEQFNAQASGVYVDLIPPNYGASEFTLPAMTDGLDCFAWHRPPTAAERAGLLDLQPLIDAQPPADGVSMRDDYPEALAAPFRADGRLYGLPYAVGLRAMSYNRGAFEAAGLEPPRADWELADLLDAAARLTEREGPSPRYGYAIQGDPTIDLLAFLEWQGAAPFTSGASRAPRFTDPQVTQALRAYISLLRDYSPHTSISGYHSGPLGPMGALGLPQSGQVGMWRSSGADGISISITSTGDSAPPPDLAIAPPPLGDRALTQTDISASGLMIAASTPHPDACWQWLTFLSQQAGGLGQQFPARRSVATSEAFLSQAQTGAADLYAAYADALARPVGDASYAGIDPFWLMQAVDRALQGGDLARELESAQGATEIYMACVAGGETPQACAKQADPQYAGLGPIPE